MSYMYSNDTIIYFIVKPRQEDIDTVVQSIERCVTEIRIPLKTNSLKLNDTNTEVICFGSVQQLKKIKLQALCVSECFVRVTHNVCNLGVQFDAEMTLVSHVTAVCKSAIFHLRTISRIRRYLTAAATEQVTHAFVTPWLDVGNVLLYRLFLKPIQRLQKIQNWTVSVATPCLWNAQPKHLTLNYTTAAF